VNNLLTTAKMREKEKERVYEKQLLKERQLEDKEFGDKPKYMTAAYKKKLNEDKKWEYEDKLADEIEKNTDIRKSGMEGIFIIITFVNLLIVIISVMIVIENLVLIVMIMLMMIIRILITSTTFTTTRSIIIHLTFFLYSITHITVF